MTTRRPWSDPTELDFLYRQLERMRSMQYHYHEKFFFWQMASVLLFVAILLWANPIAGLLIPFLVVTWGVQSSFYLHFSDFARTHAAAIEQKINAHFGKKILVGAEIESAYFYDCGEPRIGGLLFRNPLRFFSVFTAHWIVVWMGFAVAGIFNGFTYLEDSLRMPYIWVFGLWAFLHLAYFVYYFTCQPDLSKVRSILEEL